ncbi:MAG: hypothetical protein QW594_03105 [Candidatus Woesearchaeota archaeon]
MFSLAALSHAFAKKKKDLCIITNPAVVKNLAKLYDAYSKKDPLLTAFITQTQKKIPNPTLKKAFETLFLEPSLLIPKVDGFYLTSLLSNQGKEVLQVVAQEETSRKKPAGKKNKNVLLPTASTTPRAMSAPYSYSWLANHPYAPGTKQYQMLKKTAAIIWEQVFALKKEKASLHFELIPATPTVPLADYLDSYLITYAMYQTALPIASEVYLFSASSRKSPLLLPEPISELMMTINGLEYEKNIDEPVFASYKKLSTHLGLSLQLSTVTFGIYGEGYHGKHLFGEAIGYPTPNKKARWLSPGQMFYKFSWSPQAKEESRPPQSRIGFTSTIPCSEFIRSCYLDWNAMAKKNAKLKYLLERCSHLLVKGTDTDLVVYLCETNNIEKQSLPNTNDDHRNQATPQRRTVFVSDIDIRDLVDKEVFKKTGLKTGNMGNIPAGEVFFTPQSITGHACGDVVINIDDSYDLERQPLQIACNNGFYRILSGPKKVLEVIAKRKKEAKKELALLAKNKQIPASYIATKKANFERVGEFAINTNPKAPKSRYLIVNEKMAGMIHLALGSGFEPDRSTMYHWDMVINAKKQKITILGVDEKTKKEYLLMKEGTLRI